jgi:O-antigen/teichoic acid export membrane protein
MMNISWIKYFVGAPFRVGIDVVPILLLANLCLGVYINQSIWYKLTGQTRYGAFLAIVGALITLVLNFYWIPRIGYMGSAWATLICYASMMVLSYFMGNKHYPVNYNLRKILGYMALALMMYFAGTWLTSGDWPSIAVLFIRNIFLGAFVLVVMVMEKPLRKKEITPQPKNQFKKMP